MNTQYKHISTKVFPDYYRDAKGRRNKTMKKHSFIILLLIAFALSSCSNQQSSTQLFNNDWQFVISNKAIEEITNVNEWENVSLPHTPVLEAKVMNGQWQGTCWYKKTFSLPNDLNGQHFIFKFDGAMNVSEFWVNGQKVAKHYGGYLPVVFDFTNVAKSEENTIYVKLDNTDSEITGPKPMHLLDFNMYGGLYRNAYLITKNDLHITDPILADKTAGGGIFVTYPKVSTEQATINVQTNVMNAGTKTKSFNIINELWDGKTKISSFLSKKEKLTPGSNTDISTLITLDNPQLWSPESPSLYTLKTKVVENGKEVDVEETTIGIRSIEFKNKDFYINGKKIFLRGVNRHQEYPYVGYAMSDAAQYRDAVKIKEAGFDYVRLSHYPHSPAFMDACDKLGIVVLDAILGWQYYSTDSLFQQHIYETAHDLIRRDRNHASVYAWEVSLNESWMDEYFIDSLCNIAHSEYPGCYTAGWQEYGYNIYLQARQHRQQHYTKPQKPYNVSEYGDWEYYAQNAGLNQDNWDNLKEEERTSRQLLSDGEARLLQQVTNIQEAHNDNFNTPAFADGYWVMWDYNRGYTNDLEASGIGSIDRLPKFSYYFYQSQRNANEVSDLYSCGSMVKIASYWQANSPLNVKVYSNAQEVELFLNGKSLGKQLPDKNHISNNLAHPPFTFNTDKFEAGELVALAYINNEVVSTDTVKTPLSPVAIALKVDKSGLEPKAGVNDVVFVYASIVDKNGTTVPTNGQLILWNIEGDAQILNQDPTVTEAGISTALVKIGNSKEEIKITGKFLSLKSDSVSIKPE